MLICVNACICVVLIVVFDVSFCVTRQTFSDYYSLLDVLWLCRSVILCSSFLINRMILF